MKEARRSCIPHPESHFLWVEAKISVEEPLAPSGQRRWEQEEAGRSRGQAKYGASVVKVSGLPLLSHCGILMPTGGPLGVRAGTAGPTGFSDCYSCSH